MQPQVKADHTSSVCGYHGNQVFHNVQPRGKKISKGPGGPVERARGEEAVHSNTEQAEKLGKAGSQDIAITTSLLAEACFAIAAARKKRHEQP